MTLRPIRPDDIELPSTEPIDITSLVDSLVVESDLPD